MQNFFNELAFINLPLHHFRLTQENRGNVAIALL